jgi:hypothetical protein
MWALVTVIGHSSRTKVQDPVGFDRFHKVMRKAYYFRVYSETSCEHFQNQNVRGLSMTAVDKPNNILKVYLVIRPIACEKCCPELQKAETMTCPGAPPKTLCLSCADLGHLIYLPSGNAALTRRASKYSKLHAVVVCWSSTRKRNERQGVLVQEEALARAEEECFADSEARERHQKRDAERRKLLDEEYVRKFSDRVRELFPNCPGGVEKGIAEHACLKYSGRVGRSAAAKSLEESAVTLAVVAHIRHAETNYDELLSLHNWAKGDAREVVKDEIDHIMSEWMRRR